MHVVGPFCQCAQFWFFGSRAFYPVEALQNISLSLSPFCPSSRSPYRCLRRFWQFAGSSPFGCSPLVDLKLLPSVCLISIIFPVGSDLWILPVLYSLLLLFVSSAVSPLRNQDLMYVVDPFHCWFSLVDFVADALCFVWFPILIWSRR